MDDLQEISDEEFDDLDDLEESERENGNTDEFEQNF